MNEANDINWLMANGYRLKAIWKMIKYELSGFVYAWRVFWER